MLTTYRYYFENFTYVTSLISLTALLGKYSYYPLNGWRNWNRKKWLVPGHTANESYSHITQRLKHCSIVSFYIILFKTSSITRNLWKWCTRNSSYLLTLFLFPKQHERIHMHMWVHTDTPHTETKPHLLTDIHIDLLKCQHLRLKLFLKVFRSHEF